MQPSSNYKLWWKVATAAYLATILGLWCYWFVTNSGLVGALDEALRTTEVRGFARVEYHAPKLVGVLTLLLLLLPWLALWMMLGRRVRVPRPDDVLMF